jgi:hypothetical protein
LFWLLTRVLLSQWDHSRICRECRFSCSMKRVKILSISTA